MFGNFRMELVPSKDMDIEAVFRNTLEFLHEKYGEGILKTDMPGPTGTMHG